jgi:hypothetical protein
MDLFLPAPRERRFLRGLRLKWVSSASDGTQMPQILAPVERSVEAL